MDDKQPDGRPDFGDWRIRLGITLGVLSFCFYAVVAGLATTEAWTTINIITVAALGVGLKTT